VVEDIGWDPHRLSIRPPDRTRLRDRSDYAPQARMFTGGRGRGGSEALVADCVSGVPAPHALGAAMGELARTLQHEHASEHATLEAVTAAAVRAVPGAEHASISLVVRGKTVESRAATDPLAERIDARQTDRAQHTLNHPAGAPPSKVGGTDRCAAG